MHNAKLFALLLVAAITPSCGGEFEDGGMVHETEDAFSSFIIPSLTGSQLVAAVTIQGDPQARTGFLIAGDLVITSNRWITASTVPSTVTVRLGSATRTGRWITVNGSLPFAIVQVDSTFTFGSVVLGTPGYAPYDGQRLTCHVPSTTGDPYRERVQVIGSPGPLEFTVLSGWSAILADAFVGAPCFEGSTLIGVVVRNSSQSTSVLFSALSLREFIDDMRFLGQIRTQARNFGSATGPHNFYVAPLFPASDVMCADLEGADPYNSAPVNQYPCHFGLSQQWYFDSSLESGNVRIVSAVSGKCIDSPWGSTNTGVAVQMYTCHHGDNQRFGITAFPNGSGGYRITPKHAAPAGRCLGARGGAGLGVARIEQQACLSSNNFHQRWIFRN